MQRRNDRYLSGYRVIYKPEHFSHTLNKKGYDGYVYEHRYVMEIHLGRALNKNEIVHHIDGDKLNNDIGNLQLMTRSEHTKLHFGEARVARCLDCGCEIPIYHNQKRCLKCSRITRRKVKNRPSKDEILKLLEDLPYTKVGEMYGVSDNTIRKWLKYSDNV